MKTTHTIAIILGITAGIVLFFIPPRFDQSGAPVTRPTSYPTVTPAPRKEFSTPTRIQIKKLSLDTQVEHVGDDTKGRMDVPRAVTNTAWYSLGTKPGARGSAVIAGHYDTPTGAPGPFYNLTSLEPGDTIDLEMEDGQTLTFIVEKKQMHKDASFPIREVFAQNDKPRLNLITCSGTWDATAKNYSDRLVIYATLAN